MILALPPILARLKRRNGRLIAQMYPGTTSRLIDLSDILDCTRLGRLNCGTDGAGGGLLNMQVDDDSSHTVPYGYRGVGSKGEGDLFGSM